MVLSKELVRPTGIEPVLRASEARILSVGRRSLGGYALAWFIAKEQARIISQTHAVFLFFSWPALVLLRRKC